MIDDAEFFRAHAEKLLSLFEGVKGRPAKTVYELEEWIASPEGEAACAYDLTPEGKIIPD